MSASCRPPARQSAQRPPPAASLDLVLLQSGDHLLKLVALYGLQRAARLAKKQDLRRVGDILDQVINGALMVERVMELKLAFTTGLVDEGDGMRRAGIVSRHGVDPGGPAASEQQLHGRRSGAVSHAVPHLLSELALPPRW